MFTLAHASQPVCRMRPLVLAVLLAAVPRLAAAQVAPRSIGLELGFTRDSSAALGDRAPVALTAAWWIMGDLDATARVAWGFASRTSVREAAGSLEAGAGLRFGLARWHVLRPQVVADLAFVHVFGATPSEARASDSGVRVGAGAAMELFLGRDVSVSLGAKVTELALASGDGGSGIALAMGLAAYF